MDTARFNHPAARKKGLVTRQVQDELLVYDLERNKAHCLNDAAAKVWQYCDGSRSAGEIASDMSAGAQSEMDEQVVWYALARLQKLDLLEQHVVPQAVMSQMGRREAVRTLGLASILAVPLITSIVAPTPAQAASAAPCPSPDGCLPP